jgi:HD-GYP domain-containing protein (c-di-GMP phosphodiesterase class II)
MTCSQPSTTTQSTHQGDEVPLAELVAALSLGVDLGFGQPMEHVLRQCILALRICERLSLPEEQRSVVYYAALLVNVGCHSDAHEQAKWFGDDVAVRSTKYDHDHRSVRGAASAIRFIGAGNPPLHRFRVGLEFAFHGRHDLDKMVEGHSLLARDLAARLGLNVQVQGAVAASYERWDGKGWPGAVRGDDIPIAARITQLAEYVEVAHRLGGLGAACALARKRAGKQFDPQLAEVLCSDAEEIFEDLDSTRSWQAVITAAPALRVRLRGDAVDAALVAIADFVDIKSPYTLGHARAVAELVAGAGQVLGLSASEVRTLRRAGLVHDLGRLGVSNSIWDKRGPLGAGEWERVRMHPYLTERMLSQSAALAPFGQIAVQHHERIDGSGYPAGLSGAAITPLARVLGAADAYQTLREPRPHRAALSPVEAADRVRSDVHAERLDARAAEAVLEAAGHRPARRHAYPAGLTSREVEVLRLLARGMSSKEIASRLVLAPKTVRNHTEHIYAKTGAPNRAAASLFAVQHGLLVTD